MQTLSAGLGLWAGRYLLVTHFRHPVRHKQIYFHLNTSNFQSNCLFHTQKIASRFPCLQENNYLSFVSHPNLSTATDQQWRWIVEMLFATRSCGAQSSSHSQYVSVITETPHINQLCRVSQRTQSAETPVLSVPPLFPRRGVNSTHLTKKFWTFICDPTPGFFFFGWDFVGSYEDGEKEGSNETWGGRG